LQGFLSKESINLVDMIIDSIYLLTGLILFFSMWQLYRSYGKDKVWSLCLLGIGLFLIGTTIDLIEEFYIFYNFPGIVKIFFLMGILISSCGIVMVVRKYIDMANTDSLTGIYNKRYLKKILSMEIDRSRRFNIPMSVIFIDLDNFKEINDSMGHSTGDYVMHAVIEKIKDITRTIDSLARYGGDEFILVLPRTSSEGAHILLKRCQEMVSNLELPGGIKIGLSGGIAVFPYDGDDVEKLINIADGRMYENKAIRKNLSKE